MSLEPDEVVQALLRGRLRMAAIATVIVRDAHAAEDVFQQVVLSALEHADEFRDDAHALAWGVQAARFRAIDLARQRKLRTLSDAALDRLEARWSGVPEGELSDDAQTLQNCLDKLAPPARELLRLRYDEGLSVVAIARRLGRGAGALYQNLSRLHRALRDCVRLELVGQHAHEPRESHT